MIFRSTTISKLTIESVIESTDNSLSPKFGSAFHFLFNGPTNVQTGLGGGSLITGICWIMTWIKKKFS